MPGAVMSVATSASIGEALRGEMLRAEMSR